MIAILGSGISGLFAAWACLLNGKKFIIYTNEGKKPYVMPCTYLHQDCGLSFISKSILNQYCIPKRIDDIDVSHDYVKLGKMYSKKVYGNENASNNFVSKGLRSSHPIWNMQQAVDFLWNATRDCMEHRYIESLTEIKGLTKDNSLVISTLSLESIDFGSLIGRRSYQTRWITEFKSESKEDYCIFNVSDNADWYRMGNVFGRSFVEGMDRLEPDSYEIKKLDSIGEIPLVDNKILFTGRYGCWNQKMLAHDVFYEVLKKI